MCRKNRLSFPSIIRLSFLPPQRVGVGILVTWGQDAHSRTPFYLSPHSACFELRFRERLIIPIFQARKLKHKEVQGSAHIPSR